MDFIHDQLADRCSIRTFNVIDDSHREALGIEVDLLAAGHTGGTGVEPNHRPTGPADGDSLR